MIIGIAADHGGFALKQKLLARLRVAGHRVTDFGAHVLTADDDYPDLVISLARAVAAGNVDRGVAVYGSGVGATVCANKIKGVRACLIEEHFSARQRVEDDNLNIICLGARIQGPEIAWDLVQTFLAAKFSKAPRHLRRLWPTLAKSKAAVPTVRRPLRNRAVRVNPAKNNLPKPAFKAATLWKLLQNLKSENRSCARPVS